MFQADAAAQRKAAREGQQNAIHSNTDPTTSAPIIYSKDDTPVHYVPINIIKERTENFNKGISKSNIDSNLQQPEINQERHIFNVEHYHKDNPYNDGGQPETIKEPEYLSIQEKVEAEPPNGYIKVSPHENLNSYVANARPGQLVKIKIVEPSQGANFDVKSHGYEDTDDVHKSIDKEKEEVAEKHQKAEVEQDKEITRSKEENLDYYPGLNYKEFEKVGYPSYDYTKDDDFFRGFSEKEKKNLDDHYNFFNSDNDSRGRDKEKVETPERNSKKAEVDKKEENNNTDEHSLDIQKKDGEDHYNFFNSANDSRDIYKGKVETSDSNSKQAEVEQVEKNGYSNDHTRTVQTEDIKQNEEAAEENEEDQEEDVKSTKSENNKENEEVTEEAEDDDVDDDDNLNNTEKGKYRENVNTEEDSDDEEEDHPQKVKHETEAEKDDDENEEHSQVEKEDINEDNEEEVKQSIKSDNEETEESEDDEENTDQGPKSVAKESVAEEEDEEEIENEHEETEARTKSGPRPTVNEEGNDEEEVENDDEESKQRPKIIYNNIREIFEVENLRDNLSDSESEHQQEASTQSKENLKKIKKPYDDNFESELDRFINNNFKDTKNRFDNKKQDTKVDKETETVEVKKRLKSIENAQEKEFDDLFSKFGDGMEYEDFYKQFHRDSKFIPSKQNLIESQSKIERPKKKIEQNQQSDSTIVQPLYSGVLHVPVVQELFKSDKPLTVPFDHDYSATETRSEATKRRVKRNVESFEDEKEQEETAINEFKDESQYVPDTYTTDYNYETPEPKMPDFAKLEAKQYKDDDKLSPNAYVTQAEDGQKTTWINIEVPVTYTVNGRT